MTFCYKNTVYQKLNAKKTHNKLMLFNIYYISWHVNLTEVIEHFEADTYRAGLNATSNSPLYVQLVMPISTNKAIILRFNPLELPL